MSEVKCYGYLGIVEEEDGKVVRWENYAALKAERDALAAAHSELRESMAAIHNTIRLDGVNTSLGALLSASKRAHEASLPTDAYLNSVRAEAVQKLWNDSLNDVGHMLRDIGAFRDASGAAGIVHDEIKERVEEFAAQLRAGKESV